MFNEVKKSVENTVKNMNPDKVFAVCSIIGGICGTIMYLGSYRCIDYISKRIGK